MELRIEPLREEEIDDYIRTFWEAFEPPSADMIMPMIYLNGLQEDTMELFRYRIWQRTGGDFAKHCFTAKDVATGDIVGISWWASDLHPPASRDEIEEAYQASRKKRGAEPQVEGMNEELAREYFKVAFCSELETIAGRPYVTLRMLATNPRYHRRGVGSLLLKHGLEKADSLGLPVYLDCSVGGKPLYERYGFKVIGDFPLNCSEYGGRSNGTHWLMLREPQGARKEE